MLAGESLFTSRVRSPPPSSIPLGAQFKKLMSTLLAIRVTSFIESMSNKSTQGTKECHMSGPSPRRKKSLLGFTHFHLDYA